MANRRRPSSPNATPLFEIPSEGKAHVQGTLGPDAFRSRHEAGLDSDMHLVQRLIEAKHKLVPAPDGGLCLEGLACPRCGVATITAKNIPAVRLVPGDYPMRPTGVTCTACRKWVAKPSALFRVFYPGPAERDEVLNRDFKSAAPTRSRWTAARSGGEVAVARESEAAVNRVLGPEHAGEVELCLISAYDETQAAQIAVSGGLPWKVVSVTAKGEPRELGWHGQTPTAVERTKFDQVMDRERKEKLRELELELQVYKSDRMAELGLV